jgi:hypothetical protein
MNNIELRVPAHLTQRLIEAVRSAGPYESVAFGLVSSATLRDRTLLLLRDVIETPPDAYLDPSGHGARSSGRFTLAVLNRALAEERGVVIFHEHGFGNPVRLSTDDEASGVEQLELFARVQPDTPHGSVVVGGSTAAGIFNLSGRLVRPSTFTLRLLGGSIDFRPNQRAMTTRANEQAFARQVLLVGGFGQGRLRSSTVAVIGLCGGGSHVVQQLAHLGVGRILGIDHDAGDETNRSRMIGLTAEDVRKRRLKVDVLDDLVNRVGLGTEYIPIRAKLPSPEAVAAVREADVIVGCIDNYHARADLQSLAWRLLIPYVDIGLVIDPKTREHPSGRDWWIAGNVYTLLPGSTCLWCTDFLTKAKLGVETGGRERSYLRDGGGAAQVVSLNGVLASQGVNEVLQLLTGFAERPPESQLLKLNGTRGTLVKWKIEPRKGCEHCRLDLAAGDIQWTTPA